MESDGEHHVYKNVPLTSDFNNVWLILSFRRGVREIFLLLICYVAWIGSCRRFGQPISHLRGPGRNLRRLDLHRWDCQVDPKRRSLTANLSCVTSQKSKERGEHVAVSKPILFQ